MRCFNLYPSTIITLGANKSCIIDIERSIYCQIPNSMGAFFIDNRCFNIEQVICDYTQDERKTICDYIDFLVANKFGVRSEVEINFKYHDNSQSFISPFLYESLIVDSLSENDIKKILPFLPEKQLFRFVQLRLFFKPDFELLVYLIEFFRNRNYKNIEIIFNYDFALEVSSYEKLIDEFKSVISRLVIMGANSNYSLNDKRIIFNKTELKANTQCGIVSKDLFMTNIDTYMHSCSGNSCLYKKISIDNSGEIRSCPSIKQSFGNVKYIDIKQMVNRLDYQNINLITKNKIKVCKDCEFRYICTDCRAFTKDSNDIYSQPAKCTYNPYISKWEGEDGFISVEAYKNAV